ncbi:Z1 domain-containing protein [Pseudidiomarina sp. GXY010]|uniref:Z1 domain-containing protein n=1 Tax=Pseudidiomarina fusca TaxID=2965078 RepID=A0ABU3L0C5_9GAMM|nr:Z1 domain-containing protein [Pseudidiomarina sp. GXY010]MDT7526722.1 Z1 domain-containing protein [Pseudidiomarina sp. GXY010]
MDKQAFHRVRHSIICFCEKALERGEKVSRDFIEAAIDKYIENPVVASTIGTLTKTDKEKLKFNIETQINVRISDEIVALRNEEVKRWLDHKRDEVNWTFWNAYRTYLEYEGRTKPVIDSLERVIDLVLDATGDPTTPGSWRRSGLVMGNVQSGKTQNYIGLINKAIDAGYKVVILLGGHLNELRNQTQTRVDEGVIGRESIQLAKNQGRDKSKRVGVGKIRDESKEVIWFTSKDADFKKSAADQIGVSFNSVTSPVVFVVKKNAAILKTLYEWIVNKHDLDIQNGKLINLPLLLIDDEADYASINTKHSKNDITAINEGIRKILATSSKTNYIGYTATPFANIFIDPDKGNDALIADDLFPKDLMVRMPAPDNYVGHNHFFPYQDFEADQEVSSSITLIDDFEQMLPAKSNKETRVDVLCESLKESIQVFMLATAVRYTRSSSFTDHSTMLVNMSHLTVIQEQIASLIGDYVDKFKKANELNGTKEADIAVIESNYFSSLHDVYQREFQVDLSFSEIFPAIRKVISKLKTIAVNAGSKERLDYDEYDENGLVAIAVGGHKLSRGLTLEGLIVSYFTRNSKMYDTLMQMCRWFGYRPGYKDLCRLYITEQSLSWYTFISEAIDELYTDLELMFYRKKTPSEFGLKVREHPGSLLVTARAKMQTAESCIRSLDYAGERYRRFDFYTDSHENDKNIALVKNLISNLIEEYKYSELDGDGSYVFYDVDYEKVINFVSSFSVVDSDNSQHLVIDYLRKLKALKVPNFRVCLRNQKNAASTWWTRFNGTEERLPKSISYHESLRPIIAARRRLSFGDDKLVMRSHKSELGDPKDENILTGSTVRTRASAKDYIADVDRDFPGLIIYTFAVGVIEPSTVIREKDKEKISNIVIPHINPTVGYSLSFPLLENLKGLSGAELQRLKQRAKVLYKTNVIWREVFNEDDFEDAYDDDE